MMHGWRLKGSTESPFKFNISFNGLIKMHPDINLQMYHFDNLKMPVEFLL